ncbi:MAG: hypothetical protein E3K37_17150 [Candidatus Kuenenia sp.]|nr:hypothetical protein [Candidatus Kuenenia hertensis]
MAIFAQYIISFLKYQYYILIFCEKIIYNPQEHFDALIIKENKEAQNKLDCLSSFISDEEYNAMKAILKNWRK